MPYVEKLSGLSPREAIADAIYRAIIGFDRNDVSMFESAFIGEDVEFQIRRKDSNDTTIKGLSTMRASVFAAVGPMDTTHTISNLRIDVKDGADTASLTCNALAQHCPPGTGLDTDAPYYLVGGQYSIDIVKETDGLWKAKKWVLDVLWAKGDIAVMGGGGPPS